MNKTLKKVLIAAAAVAILIFIPYGCVKNSYNSLVSSDENVKTAWAEVENQYQRRYDLIPNLVEVVKKYASHEKETLTQVTEARAKLGGMVKLPEKSVNNPELMAKYQQAQSSLGSALRRLMVVQERYPNLKANENFRDLQVQLEGTENRITVARRRYNQAVNQHNKNVRQFPNALYANMFGFETAQHFKMESEAKTAPKVNFE